MATYARGSLGANWGSQELALNSGAHLNYWAQQFIATPAGHSCIFSPAAAIVFSSGYFQYIQSCFKVPGKHMKMFSDTFLALIIVTD